MKYQRKQKTIADTEFTSKLSPWLANGCLSVRHVYFEIKRFEKENGETEASKYFID